MVCSGAWTMQGGKILQVDGDCGSADDVVALLQKEAATIHTLHMVSIRPSTPPALDGRKRDALGAALNRMNTCPNLTVLKLKNISLSNSHILNAFLKGVKECRSLQQVVADDCHLGDKGCFSLCKVLTSHPAVSHLSLEGNDLTHEGAACIAALLERQGLARRMAWLKRSLRGRDVLPEAVLGLTRLTLNRNPQITDTGLGYLLNVLYDDFWIRAIDMKECGITSRGADEVMRLLKVNRDLEVFDLRDNDQVPLHCLCAIVQRIFKNIESHYTEIRNMPSEL